MKEVRLPQFYEQAESVWKKFLQALPVIAFFLILFYSVIYLFGMQYTMIVSLVTVVFQVNYKKRNIPAGALTKLLVQQIFLLCLAYTATWNLILSLLLNLVVPFWLIFIRSSIIRLWHRSEMTCRKWKRMKKTGHTIIGS